MAPIPLDSRSLNGALSSIASLAKRHPTSSSLSTIETTQLSQRSTNILSNLFSRQSNPNIIPSTYGAINSGPSPGTVVGIVIGSVGGFLLVLWLIYTCLNFGSTSSSSSYTDSVVVRERRKSHGSQRSRRVSETVEVRRDRSPIRIVRDEPRIVREPERVERIIVEEERREIRRDRSRGSDEVVVIEEHSPPRRSKSKRERRDEERRETGFRTVDPLAFAGTVGGRKTSSRR